VGPAHISQLSECLDQAGYALTAAL